MPFSSKALFAEIVTLDLRFPSGVSKRLRVTYWGGKLFTNLLTYWGGTLHIYMS